MNIIVHVLIIPIVKGRNGFYVAFISRRERNPEPGRNSLLFTNSFQLQKDHRQPSTTPNIYIATRPTRLGIQWRLDHANSRLGARHHHADSSSLTISLVRGQDCIYSGTRTMLSIAIPLVLHFLLPRCNKDQSGLSHRLHY